MPRPGLTDEQLLAAVEELVNTGQAVTVSAVREKLGTGSFSTINAFLSKWKAQVQVEQTIPTMPEAVAHYAKGFWSVAYQSAQESVKLERQGLDQAKQAFTLEKQELEAEIARLESNVADHASKLEAREVQYRKSQQAKKSLEEEVQALKVENATLGERATNADERVKWLEGQLAKLTESLKALALAPPSPSNTAATSGSNPSPGKKVNRPKSEQT